MNVAQAIHWAQRELQDVSGDDATADARNFVCCVMGVSMGEILRLLADPVQGRQEARLREMVRRRKEHEPTQYIVGSAQFLGYEIHCDERALIPRFETEYLALEAQRLARTERLCGVLDLCTGSGALAVALSLSGLSVSACDLSEDALMLAMENAQRHGAQVKFYQGDLFQALPRGAVFDMIVSNPPYVKSADIDTLPMEIRAYEPHLALDGGADGLLFYRRIAREAPLFLRAGGFILLEVGEGQGRGVCGLMEESFEGIDILPDMRGIGRLIRARRKE